MNWKKKLKINEKVAEDFLTLQLLSNLNDVLEIETKNHSGILKVIADSMLSKYPIEKLSALVANHIRYTYTHSKECMFDDEVLVWASGYNDFKTFSIDVNGKHFTDKDLLIKNLTPSDANFFAWYCIERTVNSK